MLSYFENRIFFETMNVSSQNSLFFFSMIFINNVVAISLILLGMTFYVDLVMSDFFKREKYAQIVLEHPQIFAIVFTFIILFLSILKAVNVFFGAIIVETLPVILLVSAPVGLIEGYGIYLTIKKTLSRTVSTKDLVYICMLFLIAATVEVSFTNLLT